MTQFDSYYAQPSGGPPQHSGAPTLDQPHYGIGPFAAVGRAFRKFATFAGRASRSEYWWWVLFSVVFFYGPSFLVYGTAEVFFGGGGVVSESLTGAWVWVWIVLCFLPGLAVLVRRLHDGGHTGWLALMSFVPILGPLIILVFASMPSSPSGVRFDRRPTQSEGHAALPQQGYGPAYGQEPRPPEGGYSADPYGR